MNDPSTIYDVLQLLEVHDDERRSDYERLRAVTTDPQAQFLLEHLVLLEDHSLQVIRSELEQLDPGQSTYLMPCPDLDRRPGHATECRCDHDPSFQEILACVQAAAQLRSELLQCLEGGSAALSVQSLAERQRELEEIQGRRIANFTRQD